MTGPTQPTEKETDQLPQRVQTQTAGHDWIAFKMAVEEPEVRIDIELCDDFPFAVLSAAIADMGNAVEHEHGREGQLGITWPE